MQATMNVRSPSLPLSHRHQPGFTIVELLIVIVIIGILATITIVAYNGIQNRARAAAVTTGIKKIEKAFRLMAIDEKRATWWGDSSASLTSTSNPLISDIITATNLKLYLQSAPDVPGLTGGFWWYDNDNDTYDPAGCVAATTGVNIAYTNIPQAVAQQVDSTLDDGNLLCGKVRFNTASGDRLFYAMSETSQIP